MDVQILNPDAVRSIYRNHGQFACVCYNTDERYAERVGKNCEQSGHMSGSRCEYIKFKITGVDRGTAEQIMRHEIGTSIPTEMQDNYTLSDFSEVFVDVSPDQIVKNMASFRYIDKTDFEYAVPRSIARNPIAKEVYKELMGSIDEVRRRIKDALITGGVSEKQAVQDSNFVLPRATTSTLIVGFTPEALIHFCHKRLCNRAQEFIQQVAELMRDRVYELNKDFAKELMPHCLHLLWCPEGKASCGLMPTKDELREKLETKGESS